MASCAASKSALPVGASGPVSGTRKPMRVGSRPSAAMLGSVRSSLSMMIRGAAPGAAGPGVGPGLGTARAARKAQKHKDSNDMRRGAP